METLEEKIVRLLEKYFYGQHSSKYHVSMTSRLVVEKVFNEGRGCGMLFMVRHSDKTIWVNDNLATRRDYAQLRHMLAFNRLKLTIVKKSYDMWNRTWSDINTAA